jgi:hypothetical protein
VDVTATRSLHSSVPLLIEAPLNAIVEPPSARVTSPAQYRLTLVSATTSPAGRVTVYPRPVAASVVSERFIDRVMFDQSWSSIVLSPKAAVRLGAGSGSWTDCSYGALMGPETS